MSRMCWKQLVFQKTVCFWRYPDKKLLNEWRGDLIGGNFIFPLFQFFLHSRTGLYNEGILDSWGRHNRCSLHRLWKNLGGQCCTLLQCFQHLNFLQCAVLCLYLRVLVHFSLRCMMLICYYVECLLRYAGVIHYFAALRNQAELDEVVYLQKLVVHFLLILPISGLYVVLAGILNQRPS